MNIISICNFNLKNQRKLSLKKAQRFSRNFTFKIIPLLIECKVRRFSALKGTRLCRPMDSGNRQYHLHFDEVYRKTPISHN